MNRQPTRLLYATLLAALLAGCGGGESTEASAAAAAAVPADTKRALADAGPQTPGTSELFDWAQAQYPTLFEAGPQTAVADYEGRRFEYRYYPGTDSYLGVNDGEVFGLGPFTGNRLQGFGRVADYGCQVRPLACAGASVGRLVVSGAGLATAGGDGNFVVDESLTKSSAATPICTQAGDETACESMLSIGWTAVSGERLQVVLRSSYRGVGVRPGNGINGIDLAYTVVDGLGASLACRTAASSGLSCDPAALGVRVNSSSRTVTFVNTAVAVAGGAGSIVLNGTLRY